MIWIRADANKEIGTGHIMRCLSIAGALIQFGERVCFLVADEKALPLLESRGQAYRVLNTDYREPEDELAQLRAFFSEDKPGLLLVDSYFATSEYVRRVREFVPVGYMDDTGRTDLPVNFLINYNVFAKESLYCEASFGTRFFLGLQYVPLREEFKDVEYKVRERATSVLLTTGGSDRFNLAAQILQCALENENTASLRYRVVSGTYNVHLEELKRIEEKHPNVEIYCNVSNMSELMRECDIAVSAGGSTMYELAAVGVPTICFSFVDNQERIVEGFCRQKLVFYGGNYLTQESAMITEVVENIGKLACDAGTRQMLSDRQKRMIDGQGARRIARELMQFK